MVIISIWECFSLNFILISFNSKKVKKMVRLGTCFTNYVRYSCRGRRILEGLERRKKYISPENNAGVWHGAGVKSGFIETFSGKK